jgi:hypothetical protein
MRKVYWSHGGMLEDNMAFYCNAAGAKAAHGFEFFVSHFLYRNKVVLIENRTEYLYQS